MAASLMLYGHHTPEAWAPFLPCPTSVPEVQLQPLENQAGAHLAPDLTSLEPRFSR